MTDPLSTAFAALADPTRRRILEMLLEDDQTVTDLAEPFDMSLAAVSKHIALLVAAGLVTTEKRGRIKWCGLEPTRMRAAAIWMESFGQFEAVNLEAFERFLDHELGQDGSVSDHGTGDDSEITGTERITPPPGNGRPPR